MSRVLFDDECPGCRPTMVDVKTGAVFSDISIEMTIVNRLWSETTIEERRAWHRVTCQSSRALVDVQGAKAFADRVEEAFAVSANEKERFYRVIQDREGRLVPCPHAHVTEELAHTCAKLTNGVAIIEWVKSRSPQFRECWRAPEHEDLPS